MYNPKATPLEERAFTLCRAGMEILDQAMVTKEGKGIHSSETLAQEMHSWLLGKMNKCLKKTDGLR